MKRKIKMNQQLLYYKNQLITSNELFNSVLSFLKFFRTIFADVVNTTHKIYFVNFEIIF